MVKANNTIKNSSDTKAKNATLDFLFFLKRLYNHSELVISHELSAIRDTIIGKSSIETESINHVDYSSKFKPAIDNILFFKKPKADKYIEREVDRDICEWFVEWNKNRSGSFAIVAEPGMGKTTTLERYKDKSTIFAQFKRFADEKDLVRFIGTLVGRKCNDLHDLIEILNSKRRRIFLDDCHLLFLRKIDGLKLVNTLFYILEGTQKNVLWITAWDKYAYYYLNEVLKLSFLFSKVKIIEPMNETQLKLVINSLFTSKRIKINVKASSEYVKTHRTVEPDKVEEEIWSMLTKLSYGNPVATLQYIKHSVELNGNMYVLKSISKIKLASLLEEDDERLFALAAFLFHGGLHAEEFSEVMGLDHISSRILLSDLYFKRLIIKSNGFYRIPVILASFVEDALRKRNIVRGDV